MKFRDLSGHEFGLLLVTPQFERRPCANRDRFYWLCDCKCGKQTWVSTSDLVTSHARSCGCQRIKDFRERVLASKPWLKGNIASTTHGGRKSLEYQSWFAMIQRCRNPKSKSFKNYGGRGITVHPSLFDFATFLALVGPRPTPKHTIERINNDGNYEPGNLKWATRLEQAHNKRNNIK